MYTVKELAERYNVTRKTVYKWLKHDDIQEYLFTDEKGLKLIPEGLNVFNIIMANNSTKKDDIQEGNTNINNVVNDELIRVLREQIEELKKDKEELRQDKEKLFNELQEQRQLLLTGKQEKKGFLKWFTR